MATAIRNGTGNRNGGVIDRDRENFHKFFECWLSEQNQRLQELISATKNHPNNNNFESDGDIEEIRNPTMDDDQVLSQLVQRVIEHYELYYRAKSRWAKKDVLSILTPPWRSTLEDAFLWIGGWRPSMAFHLFYSKSGLQLEGNLSDLISGLSTGDLADLSAEQFNHVDDLQGRTISEEKEITEKMAKVQETIADKSMVELSHLVTDMIQNGVEGEGDGGVEEARVEATLAAKEQGLEELVEKADDLRLRTLKSILGILSPTQAVHFLIAAAELHLRLHDWGKKRDARTGQAGNGRAH